MLTWHLQEVKRTLFVTGLHRDVGWHQISQFFAREVRAVKLYVLLCVVGVAWRTAC
jgi:hypothetical protein